MYEWIFRTNWLLSEANNIQDVIDILREFAYDIEKMKNDGLVFGRLSEDYYRITTDDETLAKKYELEKVEFDEEEEE